MEIVCILSFNHRAYLKYCFFREAIIPIENKYSQGDDEHPLTIFMFYGAYVFAKKHRRLVL